MLCIQTSPNPTPPCAPQDPSKGEASPLCAVGSADKRVTVWSTMHYTPLLVVQDAFNNGVLDLVWLPDGLGLIASSYDGTIAVCTFREEELGRWCACACVVARIATRL